MTENVNIFIFINGFTSWVMSLTQSVWDQQLSTLPPNTLLCWRAAFSAVWFPFTGLDWHCVTLCYMFHTNTGWTVHCSSQRLLFDYVCYIQDEHTDWMCLISITVFIHCFVNDDVMFECMWWLMASIVHFLTSARACAVFQHSGV